MTEVCAVLRVDLREQWRSGSRVSAETYLDAFPQVAADRELAADLIYTEFLLREDRGEHPTVAEYIERFPQHADALSTQIAIHNAVCDAERVSLAGDARDSRTAELLANDAASEPARDQANAPRRIGRYDCVRLLGRGGMGEVWLAHDEQLDRNVALKLPRFSETCRDELVDRFHREARAVAKLAHPNLCVIHDVGQEDGVPFLAMQYLPGESLAYVLQCQGALPPLVALSIARKITLALEVVHQAGVLHRDLKPGNVMFNDHDEPVVMDFGLALLRASAERIAEDRCESGLALDTVSHAREQAARLTLNGQLLGTPAYAAPEQFSGATAILAPACDVYSLGAVLFEMLTGRTPFLGDITEIIRQIQNQRPPQPSQFNATLPPCLDPLCTKALEKDPGVRYESMSAFRTAIEQAARTIERTRGNRPGRMHRRTFIAAATALTCTAAAVFQRSRSTITNEQRTDLSAGPSANPKFDTAETPIQLDPQAPQLRVLRQHAWPKRHAYSTGFSPNGQYYWAGGEYFRNEIVRVWETENGREVLSVPGGYLRFSPDSGRVYSPARAPNSIIGAWDIASKERIRSISTSEVDLAIDLAAHPDGQRILTSHKSVIKIWDVTTQAEVKTLPLGSLSAPRICLLNNGEQALVYDLLVSEPDVRLINLGSGVVSRRFHNSRPSNTPLARTSIDGREFAIVNRRAIDVWDIVGTMPKRRLCVSPTEAALEAKAISADLKWGLCSLEQSQSIYLVNLETATTHGVFSLPDADHREIFGDHDFSPDGRYAVFCSPYPSTVFVLEMPPEVWRDSS